MSKITFTINEKADRSSLSSTDNFLMETSANTTFKTALNAIYKYIKDLLASESSIFDHTKLSNIGTKTHTQIDTFINNAATSFATSSQGEKADTALQPTSDGSGLINLTKGQVGLDQADNTADINKPVSKATQAALDEKENKIKSSAIIYIDNTRTGTYTETGSFGSPYKSITNAMAGIAANLVVSQFVVNLIPSSYTESDITIPSGKAIAICGNKSTVTANLVLNSSVFDLYDCTIIGSVSSSSSSDSAHTFINVNITGAITDNNIVTIKFSQVAGKITNTRKLQVFASRLQNQIANDYVIEQTGSAVSIVGCTIYNTLGNGVLINNSATVDIASCNIIQDCIISTSAGGIAVNSGSASTLLSKNVTNGSLSGSSLISASFDAFGPSLTNFGSDATGDIYYRSASGVLARLGIGPNNNILYSNGTAPYWGNRPVDISGNAATATRLAESRTINGVPFDGSQNIIIEAEDPYNSNNLLEVDLTSGDFVIDSTNCQYAGYILYGTPSKQVSVIIKSQDKYYKIINKITTNYPVIIESGV